MAQLGIDGPLSNLWIEFDVITLPDQPDLCTPIASQALAPAFHLARNVHLPLSYHGVKWKKT